MYSWQMASGQRMNYNQIYIVSIYYFACLWSLDGAITKGMGEANHERLYLDPGYVLLRYDLTPISTERIRQCLATLHFTSTLLELPTVRK